MGQQRLAGIGGSPERTADEGRRGGAVRGFQIRTEVEEQLAGGHLVLGGRPVQSRQLEVVPGIEVLALRVERPEALQVPGAGRRPEVAVQVRRRVLAPRGPRGRLEGLRRVAQREALAHRPLHQGEDGEARDDHRHQDSPDPVRDQAARPSALPEHHREVAAQEEEQRHAEAVDEGEERGHLLRAHLVGDHPGNEGQGEARVEHDAERHGEAPDGVEVMAPDRLGGSVRGRVGGRPLEGSAWSSTGRQAANGLNLRTNGAGVQGSNPTITLQIFEGPSQTGRRAHLARSFIARTTRASARRALSPQRKVIDRPSVKFEVGKIVKSRNHSWKL